MANIFSEIGFLPFVWLLIAIMFFVLEALTVQLVSIWLGISAIITIIPATLQLSFSTQIIIFAISSILCVIATRPFVKKITSKSNVYRTNADIVIDKDAVVIEEINNLDGCGRVKVSGVDWAARSADGSVISVDQTVHIEAIEGVKVIVTCNEKIKI